MPLALAALLAILVLTLGPGLWVRTQFARHGKPRDDFPGTGGDLARELLDRADLATVPVEASSAGDHYDPRAKAVRLTPAHRDGKSVTAVAVAAHEVGHALQDRDGFAPLRERHKRLGQIQALQRAGLALMAGGALAGGLSRAPVLAGLGLLGGVLVRLTGVVAALIELPTEFDASFRRALPILRADYLGEADSRAAAAVLRAAALTYVAQALLQAVFLGRRRLPY